MLLRNNMRQEFKNLIKSKSMLIAAPSIRPSKFGGSKRGFADCKEQNTTKNTNIVLFSPLLGTCLFWKYQIEALQAEGFNNIYHMNPLGENTIDGVVKNNWNTLPKRFVAVTHSLGGSIFFRLILKMIAESCLSNLKGAMVISPRKGGVSEKELVTKQMLMKKLEEVKRSPNFAKAGEAERAKKIEEAVATIYFPPASPVKYSKEVILDFIASSRKNTIDDIVNQLKASLSRGNDDAVTAINAIIENKIPISFLFGKRDPIIPLADWREFLNSKSGSHCEIDTFPEGAHLLPLEYHKEVNAKVLKILNTVETIEEKSTISAVLSNPNESQCFRLRP